MRKTRIIGTIGPASDNEDTLEALVDAGLNIARLNYSHGDLEQKTELIQKLRNVEFKFGKPLGILADLPGPKLRLGTFSKSIKLSKNDIINLYCGKEKLSEDVELIQKSENYDIYNIPVSYGGLSEDLNDDDAILIADGTVRLVVESSPNKTDSIVNCKVIEPGIISSRKGVNVPGTMVSLPSVGEKDLVSIKHALENNVDFIAVSYVRNAKDLQPAVDAIKKEGNSPQLLLRLNIQQQ